MNVCLGYDIRTESGYDEMMHDLQEFIGLKYLKAVHMNDSRGDLFAVFSHRSSNCVIFLSLRRR